MNGRVANETVHPKNPKSLPTQTILPLRPQYQESMTAMDLRQGMKIRLKGCETLATISAVYTTDNPNIAILYVVGIIDSIRVNVADITVVMNY